MSDIRARNCVVVSHCILAQGVMADGLVKHFPGPIKPILQFCLDNDIAVMQMPCPETLCAAGGLGRMRRGKQWYEKNGLRNVAGEIADGQAAYMQRLIDGGFRILAIIGVEFSPACAVTFLNKGPAVYRDEGIYVEELRRAMKDRDIEVPFVGISPRWHKKMVVDLRKLLEHPRSDGSGSLGGQIESSQSVRDSLRARPRE
jgi:predicted secreted protein